MRVRTAKARYKEGIRTTIAEVKKVELQNRSRGKQLNDFASMLSVPPSNRAQRRAAAAQARKQARRQGR